MHDYGMWGDGLAFKDSTSVLIKCSRKLFEFIGILPNAVYAKQL